MKFKVAFSLSLAALAHAVQDDFDKVPRPLPARSGLYPNTLPDGRRVVGQQYGDDWKYLHTDHVDDWQSQYGTEDQVFPHNSDTDQRRKDRKHDSLQTPGRHHITGVSQVKDEKAPASVDDPYFRSQTSYRALPRPESGGYSKKMYIDDNPNDPQGYGYDRFKSAQRRYKKAETATGAKIFTNEANMASSASTLLRKTGPKKYDGTMYTTSSGWHPLGDQGRAHEAPARLRSPSPSDKRSSLAYPELRNIRPKPRVPFFEGGGHAPTSPNPYWTKGLDSTGSPLTDTPGSYVSPPKMRSNTFDPKRRSTFGIQSPSESYARKSHPNRPQSYATYDPTAPTPPRDPVVRPQSSRFRREGSTPGFRTNSFRMDDLRDALPEERRGRDRRPPVSSQRFFDSQPSSSSVREPSRQGRSKDRRPSSSRDSSLYRDPSPRRDPSPYREPPSYREPSRVGRSSQRKPSSSRQSLYGDPSPYRDPSPVRAPSRLGRSNSISYPPGGTGRLTSDYKGRGKYYDYDSDKDGEPSSHSAPNCYWKRDLDGKPSSGCDVTAAANKGKGQQPAQQKTNNPVTNSLANKGPMAPANNAQVAPPMNKSPVDAAKTKTSPAAASAVSAQKKPVAAATNAKPVTNQKLAAVAPPVKAASVAKNTLGRKPSVRG